MIAARVLAIAVLGIAGIGTSGEAEVITPLHSQLPGFLEFSGEPNGHGGARASNFDWNQVMQTTNILHPNAVIADDFASSSVPVQNVRWWGAYLAGFTPGSEDGYLLSFFAPNSSVTNTGRPGSLLGTYVAPLSSIRTASTQFLGSDGNRIYQYEVDLRDTYLVHAVTNFARPDYFRGRINTLHWLAISAEVGHRALPQTNQFGTITNWIEQATEQRATNHFWGWQTSPSVSDVRSMTGNVAMSGTNWVYPVPLWQTNAPIQNETSQAFELLTRCDTNPPKVLSATPDCARSAIDVMFSKPMHPYAVMDLFNYSLATTNSSVAFVHCVALQSDLQRASVFVAGLRCDETYQFMLPSQALWDTCGVFLAPPLTFTIVCACPQPDPVPCAPTTLSAVTTPCGLVLSWRGTGYCLESSEELGMAANWTTVPDPWYGGIVNTSPAVLPASEQQQFFRLACPCP